MIPKKPWIRARHREILAILKCQIRGILVLPFKFIYPIYAVKRKQDNVKIPIYIISGFPKIIK